MNVLVTIQKPGVGDSRCLVTCANETEVALVGSSLGRIFAGTYRITGFKLESDEPAPPSRYDFQSWEIALRMGADGTS